MKKILFILLAFSFCFSCSDEPEHRMSGMWQLKTVNVSGHESRVDTVFYSFQRGVVFSFTVLLNENETLVSYGYLDFPSEKEMIVSLDTTKNSSGNYININEELVNQYGWSNDNKYEKTFLIERLSSKKMVLSSEGTIYSFNKY